VDSIVRPFRCNLVFDALDCRDYIAEAAGATRIPDIAGAPLPGDVSADSIDNVGPFALNELGANTSFCFSEAVAQKPRARNLLVPNRHPNVLGAKAVTGVAKIHNLTRRVAAELIVGQLNPPQRYFSQ
jgi:hypothetical protein